jgi:hypothetical protein
VLGVGGEVEEVLGGAVRAVDALHLVQDVALREHLVEVVPHVGAVRARAEVPADGGRRVPGRGQHAAEAAAAVAARARRHAQLLHHRRRVAEGRARPGVVEATGALRLRSPHAHAHHHQRHRHHHRSTAAAHLHVN